ncbi:MAG: GDSL-type esterase/lipase family protein [Candidatus Lernaella stagnicola]|nr:GDSL-type esterase/lipase family protein [Candidatus Lernaella stagnicola]
MALVLTVALLVWFTIEAALDHFDPAGRIDNGDLPDKLRTWNLREHTNLFRIFDEATSIALRGESWPIAKPPGERRVLCLGSSSTYGAGLSAEQAYPARLEARLGTGFQVGNAGWGGYNSFQLSIYLRQVLLRTQPDFLVFYYGGNEQFGADTIAYWRYATGLLEGFEGTPDEAEMALRYGTTNRAAIAVIDRLHRSRLYIHLRDAVVGARRARFEPSEADRLDSAVVLQKIVDAAESAGARVILIPEVEVGRGLVNRAYDRLMFDAAMDSQAVYFYIPEGIREPENFIDTVHFNQKGADRLAELVAPLVRKGLRRP